MNPMDEAEKKSVLDMLQKLSDEKLDMFLNYLKYLASSAANRTSYISLRGDVVPLSDSQALDLMKKYNIGCRLSTIPVGGTFKVGPYEFVVLAQKNCSTSAIMKEPYIWRSEFGTNNNYEGSTAERICNKFANELKELLGKHRIREHTVNLISDDGLKQYGTVKCFASLLTTSQYRKYVDVLDKHKIDNNWWLATSFSTPEHLDSHNVKCVSNGGWLTSASCTNQEIAIRPYVLLDENTRVVKS